MDYTTVPPDFTFKDLLHEVRVNSKITAETLFVVLLERTKLESALQEAQVSRESVLDACRLAEARSQTGKDILSQLRGLAPQVRDSLEAEGVATPPDLNVTLRCTPLAAELVTLSMDPGFAEEFESKVRAGDPLEDPSHYLHQPVRRMPEYIAVALETLATYATGDIAQKLRSVAKTLGRE